MNKLSRIVTAATLSFAASFSIAAAQDRPQYEVSACTSDGKTAHIVMWFADKLPHPGGQETMHSIFNNLVKDFTAEQFEQMSPAFLDAIRDTFVENDVKGAPASMSTLHELPASPDVTEGCATPKP